MTRRGMLRAGAGGAGAFMVTAGGFAVPKVFSAGPTTGNIYIEAFPTSPLILNPFRDVDENQLPIPQAEPATDPLTLPQGTPDPMRQDSLGVGGAGSAGYRSKYGLELGAHQVWPGQGPTQGYFTDTTPNVYDIKLQVAGHSFTKSLVQPIDSFGRNVNVPGTRSSNARPLPDSTIYGFNGTFPGPRINAEYGKASLVRFSNHLDVDNGFQRQDFGAPNFSFLTHLHNGHTAPESDGQPHYADWRFAPRGRTHFEAAWEPGEWVDQMYLGYPAGGDDREKQSFFWFHDHVHGFTGANVYKGMVGLMPIYDPVLDPGDERYGLRLPGRRENHEDGTFDVKFDIPLALYDCRLDDGRTPHKDVHDTPDVAGKTHPEWWGKTFFKHFPNHGFVGDVFTVNGAAYPVLRVKRRKYRLRFLDASISRIYNLQLMHSNSGPKSARELGYVGDELQGQQRLPDGQRCMKWHQIANDGGLLPNVIARDEFELWPAKRKEFIVDFTKYMDGTETKIGDEIWLVNTMKMTTGRLWDLPDPAYKVPLMRIIIEDEPGEDETDYSLDPTQIGKLRDPQPLVGGALSRINDSTIPTFELQRGTVAGDPETEWLINGRQFEANKPLISVKRDSGAVWRIRNGGGGWVHPMHLHMEEHTVIARNGKRTPTTRTPDDTGKEDVVALDPSEDTVISRRFRTFAGPYVAHCHNLAHEDHNMMFGWEILP